MPTRNMEIPSISVKAGSPDESGATLRSIPFALAQGLWRGTHMYTVLPD